MALLKDTLMGYLKAAEARFEQRPRGARGDVSAGALGRAESRERRAGAKRA